MIDTRHSDYNKNEIIWRRMCDCCLGQDAIKAGREAYLPKLNGQDIWAYERYLQRAQYVNFTGRTLNIALGQVFRKNPVIENVDEEIINDINMDGQSFVYFSRDILEDIAKYNRAGILIDWSDEQRRPYLLHYNAFEIINWNEQRINGINQNVFIVLEGFMDVQDDKDMYMIKQEKIWRVLWLNDGVYTVSVFKKSNNDGDKKFIQIEDDKVPLKNGKPFNYIPFFMCTSTGITNKISKSVLYDFANVNLGHYINSADYENMLHWTGAKTLVTQGYGNREEPIPIGGSFDLPVDGGAFYLEASSDSGLREEMNRKKEDMAVMGASLISGTGRYIASAQTASINSQGEYASLADLSKALSKCMTAVLKELAEWDGDNSTNVSVEYNTDFELAEVDPNVLTAFMGAVQSGYMSWETFFYNMKNKELYPPDWTMEDERAAIESQMEEIEEDETKLDGKLNENEQGNAEIPEETNQPE